MNVSNAIAIKNNIAARPGVPMTFSEYSTHIAPCLPPGLNTNSPANGATTLARNTDSQYMAIAIPKNHFQRFTIHIRIKRIPASTKKEGIRKAANPKFWVMKK